MEVADALCDIQYVLSGAVCEFGMGSMFKQMFEEVHRSNMSKMCRSKEEIDATLKHYKENKQTEGFVQEVSEGEFLVRRKTDSKVLKSVNYSPASLKKFLAASPEDAKGERFDSPAAVNLVAEFHRKFQCPVLDKPQIPSPDRCRLRVALIAEELKELEVAAAEHDLVEVADALCDIQYVLSGAVCEFGMGAIFKELFEEVQRSNMSKMCVSVADVEATLEHYKRTKGTEGYFEKINEAEFLVLRKADDKVLKSISYSPADLKSILARNL